MLGFRSEGIIGGNQNISEQKGSLSSKKKSKINQDIVKVKMQDNQNQEDQQGFEKISKNNKEMSDEEIQIEDFENSQGKSCKSQNDQDDNIQIQPVESILNQFQLHRQQSEKQQELLKQLRQLNDQIKEQPIDTDHLEIRQHSNNYPQKYQSPLIVEPINSLQSDPSTLLGILQAKNKNRKKIVQIQETADFDNEEIPQSISTQKDLDAPQNFNLRNMTRSTHFPQKTKRKNRSQRSRKKQKNEKQSEKQSQYDSHSSNTEILTINNLFNDEFFSGRLSVIWLFIIKKPNEDLRSKLHRLYSGLTQNEYEMPVCEKTEVALQFFKAENSYFKVVVDLDNAQQLIGTPELQSKILSIYLYNNDRQNGLSRSLLLKASSKKVRGFYSDLSPLLKRAQSDIENGNKFIREEGNLYEIKFQSRLPTFIKLSNQDKSEITAYRINLYGAIKLSDRRERLAKLEEFANLVRRVYYKDEEELENLEKYLQSIDHQSLELKSEEIHQKHFAILRFYVQETFYYKLTNNMLRVCRNVEEFKPLTIPFNQNYNAIKHFYNLTLLNQSNSLPSYQLYRGASIKHTDFQQLKQGDFIELLGFVSTSKSQSYVKENFIRNKNDFLFIFTIKTRQLDSKLKIFDHGFVDLGLYDIAQPQFKAEEEVLLNALNVYKITKIVDRADIEDQIGRVYLEYGAIFDLYEKSEDKLTEMEKSVLSNYRYCIKQMNEIQDHGDVLMKAQQYDKCKEFYQKKVKEEQKIEYFNKLAEAHYHCGQTDQARLNAVESLKKYEEEMKNFVQLNREQCMKIFQIHQKTLNIFLQKEDSVSLKKIIGFQLKILTQEADLVGKAEKLMERGSLSLKEGNIIESEKDLKQSQKILLSLKASFDLRRKNIQSKYFFRILFNCLCLKSHTVVQQKQRQIKEVEDDEREFLKVKARLQELLLKVNECLLNVAEFVGDRKSYQQCVKKGKQYFSQLNPKQTESKLQKAQIKVIQAKVQNAFQQTQHVQNSYNLLEEAIDLLEQVDPLHQKIGEYSTLLGRFKMKETMNNLILPKTKKIKDKSVQLQRGRSNSKVHPYPYPLSSQPQFQNQTELKIQINDQSKDKIQSQNQNQIENQNQAQRRDNKVQNQRQIQSESIQQNQGNNSNQRFDQRQHQQNYVEVKQNFQKALEIITYHKTQEHPCALEVRNYIGEIEYEYSQFEKGKFQANTVLKTKTGPTHSEGAKSSLLLAKIFLSQGQLKEAFQNIERAHSILSQALVKQKDNPLYNDLLTSSPIYLQIQLFKCKIFNRQTKHDLALISIQNLVNIGKKKLKDADGVGYLADIYEEMGNTLVSQGDTIKFQDYYKKAIDLRQKQMGKYNIMNAICYCTLAKYLIFTKDMSEAQKRLSDSLQIFAQFPYDHPNFWIQLSSMAFLSEKHNNTKSEITELRESVRLIEKRYSKNHINWMKMKIRYAQVLLKNDKFNEALPIYQNLEKHINEDISLTNREIQQDAKENEKVAIRAEVDKQLRQTKLRITNSRGELKYEKHSSGLQKLNSDHQKSNAKLANTNDFIQNEEVNEFNHNQDTYIQYPLKEDVIISNT